MALAENPYWVLLKAYSALPGGSKGCGGDDFSSGWSMNNFPSGEYKNFCIKTSEKVNEKYDELPLYFVLFYGSKLEIGFEFYRTNVGIYEL